MAIRKGMLSMAAAVALAGALALTGCGGSSPKPGVGTDQGSAVTIGDNAEDGAATDPGSSVVIGGDAEDGAATDPGSSAATGDAEDDVYTSWDEGEAPQYWRQVGPAVVEHDAQTVGTSHGALDPLGRATWSCVVMDEAWYEREEAEGRESAQLPDPSGWGSNSEVEIVTPSGKAYHGYFWNRSHLVGDALGGEPIAENLVTGTRMQNVGANDGKGGMLYLENMARDWCSGHAASGATLYYCATPVYVGGELIPRSVVVDIKASDGSLDGRYVVYNYAKGYTIDYTAKTDPSYSEGDANDVPAGDAMSFGDAAQSAQPAQDEHAEATETVYVAKASYEDGRGKFHTDPSCRGLKNAREVIEVSLSDAEGAGMEPCKLCH